MLREVKGLINRNCCSDTDKHEAPERVVYAAFDRDRLEKDKVSGETTGRVSLDEDELTVFSGEGLKELLDQPLMDYNKATYPWIYRWLDTGCYSLYYRRQAGRAMLFLEIDKVIEKLRTAILKFTIDTHVKDLNIYILSGISGSTGGGTFLDMAYIVRNVAEEVVGSSISGRMNIRILGYLIMPDVNLLKADNEASRSIILKNAGAALQELDNAMRLPETGDYYECQYSQTLTVRTDRAPFNFVNLISAKAQEKSMPDEPYQHCLDTVAGSILYFVSSRQVSGVGNNVDIAFPADTYYSNITSKQRLASAKNTYKERPNCYLSVGYDCWEIPADRMVKYIFTQMFSKIDDLFKSELVQADADRFMKEMRYHCEDLVEILMGKRINPLNPAQFDSTMLFGQEGIELGEYLPFDERCRDIDNRFHALMSEFEKELKEELQESFRDAERGPIWTGDLLVSTFSHIRSLDVLIEDEKNSAIQCRSAAWNRCTAILQDINRIRENCRSLTGDGKIDDYIDEYIDAWNEYYNSYLEAHCYDLLSGNTAVLEETSEGYERGFYDEVLKTAAIYNNKWLDVTRKVLEELRNVVRENTDEIKKTNAARGGFLWEKGDIPNLDRAIDNIIDQAGISKSDLLQRFLDRLPDKADEWVESVEVRKFLEEFIEDEAQPVLNASLENLLSSNFAGDGALSQSVKEDLMPKMEIEAIPLFDGNFIDKFVHITVPQDCPLIRAGARALTANRSVYDLQTSFLRNRISVISTAVGLSLHDYAWSEECEHQLSLDPNDHGLFLNQADTDFPGARNDFRMPLPSIIPTRKRLADQSASE